jgi:hypothetical protein
MAAVEVAAAVDAGAAGGAELQGREEEQVQKVRFCYSCSTQLSLSWRRDGEVALVCVLCYSCLARSDGW